MRLPLERRRKTVPSTAEYNPQAVASFKIDEKVQTHVRIRPCEQPPEILGFFAVPMRKQKKICSRSLCKCCVKCDSIRSYTNGPSVVEMSWRCGGSVVALPNHALATRMGPDSPALSDCELFHCVCTSLSRGDAKSSWLGDGEVNRR